MIDIDVRRMGAFMKQKTISAKRSLPFVQALGGKYTHRVRFLTLHNSLETPHAAIQCWCGVLLLASEKKGNGTKLLAEPSERPICATCEGRAIGAGKVGAREINGKPVMFSPMHHSKSANESALAL